MSADVQYFTDGTPVPAGPGQSLALTVRLAPADEAIERERNRRIAKETIDAERAQKVPVRTGRVKVADLVAQAVIELEVRREHGLTGFRTGVESFDRLAAPMFQPGRVIGVAASTKVGKTALLGQWLVHFAAQGIPTLLFSFEDEETDTVYRWTANVGSGDVGAIRAGFVDFDGTKRAIPEAFDKATATVAALPIELTNTPATCAQMAYEVGDWKSSWAPGTASGVVIVDQLSHIVPDDAAVFASKFPGYTPPPSPDNTTKLLEWQTAMLQRIARRWNVLVIVALQRNENDQDHEEPTVRSVRDSRGITHKLDGLVIPWRPARIANPNAGPGEPQTLPNESERMWLCAPIARGVKGGFRVEVQWQGVHQRVSDLGAQVGDAWNSPALLTAEKAAGIMALSAVRAKWRAHVDQVSAAANGAGPAPAHGPATLKAISTLGAKWQLPAKPVAAVEVAMAEYPLRPGGFSGGFAGPATTDPFVRY